MPFHRSIALSLWKNFRTVTLPFWPTFGTRQSRRLNSVKVLTGRLPMRLYGA